APWCRGCGRRSRGAALSGAGADAECFGGPLQVLSAGALAGEEAREDGVHLGGLLLALEQRRDVPRYAADLSCGLPLLELVENFLRNRDRCLRLGRGLRVGHTRVIPHLCPGCEALGGSRCASQR